MSLKSRLLRILLAVTAVLGFAGYFAFSTFLFSPLEGDYESDLSTLVPRNVDFFVAKARLAEDFAPFPRLAAAPALSETPAWRTFVASPEYAALERKYGIEERLAEVERQLTQLHGIDPLKVFGGSFVSIAGRFQGKSLADADWAIYGRANWMGKLGVSALSYPALLGLEDQGLNVAVENDHVALSGPKLPREIFVTRLRDVIVAGTSLELVRAALDLDARAGQDSFGQSAQYFDHIQNAVRSPARDEFEVFLDWRKLSEQALLSGRWPPPDGPGYLQRLLARFFQIGSIKEIAGVLGLEGGLHAHLHADLTSEMVTPLQERLYRRRGRDRREILRDAAALAPDDTGIFVYLQIGVGDLLREMLAAAEPALRSNAEDLLRSTGVYTGSEPLITEIEELFRDGVALIVRENDYPVDAQKDPPNNGLPTYAVALVLWTDGSEKARTKIDELQTLVVRNQQALGLRGANPGAAGVFYNEVGSGHMIWEFWSPLITGTGHLATVVDDRRFIVSNSFRMLGDVIGTLYRRQGSRPALSEALEFKGLVNEGLLQANALLWLAPRKLGPTARKMAGFTAHNQVLGSLDQAKERVREEALVLRQDFGGRSVGQLGPDEKAKLDESVNARMDALQQKQLGEAVPALTAAFERRQAYLEYFGSMLCMLALDPKHMELSLGALE
jgi:hypothetical protein